MRVPDLEIGSSTATAAVFAITLAATFLAAWLGRRQSVRRDRAGLSDERLNKWLVGLSAGAAANSGFVVTGAVGLGYAFGLQWLLLPLGWLVGDIVFWRFFPQRINATGRASGATTLSELLTHDLPARGGNVLALLAAFVILLCLGSYLSAQWLAGQRFLAGAFPVSGLAALGLFAVLIITYTGIGGFRGSVYVDALQALIRVVGTAIALGAVVLALLADRGTAAASLAEAGPEFLTLMPTGLGAGAGIIIGFAAAAFGFGLGQPHIVSRYLAGSSPSETQSAWWIYIAFVQFTWIAMTVFGTLLRLVMPGLAEPEAGLSIFFEQRMHPVLTGIIVADVFATIAATSNALLIAMGQSIKVDIGRRVLPGAEPPLWLACAGLGLLTMAVSLSVHGTVVDLALVSVSLMGAGVAPAVLVKVSGWRHDAASLIAAVVVGLGVAILWRVLGLGPTINEALPGILSGLAANALWIRIAALRVG